MLVSQRSFFDTAVVYVYHIPQACFCTDRYEEAMLYYELTREKKDTQAVVLLSRVFFTDTNSTRNTVSAALLSYSYSYLNRTSRYSSTCISYPSQARFCTDRYDLLQQYLYRVQHYYCLFTALLLLVYSTATVIFTPREGSYNMNQPARRTKDAHSVVLLG